MRIMMKRLALIMAAVALAGAPGPALADEAIPVQELVLRTKPAVALVTARVDAEASLNCGPGPITVKPAPVVETGTGWFVEGRRYLITNAHVVDPAHRLPPWVSQELKKSAVDEACVTPLLARQGVMGGSRPDFEDQIRRRGDMARITLTVLPQVILLLPNGAVPPA